MRARLFPWEKWCQSLCVCVCVGGEGTFFDHKFHADLLPWMLYIVNIAHTYMPLLCKRFLFGFHATMEHALAYRQCTLINSNNFIILLWHYVAHEAMMRHMGAREGHRQGDRDSDSLLFCFCYVLVATNQCCREEPCLNSHYCPTKTALIL